MPKQKQITRQQDNLSRSSKEHAPTQANDNSLNITPHVGSIIQNNRYTPSDILQLQQQLGNRATRHLLRQTSDEQHAHTVEPSNTPHSSNKAQRKPLRVNQSMSRAAIARKKKAMHLDFVRMKRNDVLYGDIIGDVIKDKLGLRIEDSDESQYGHWWTEVGDLDNGNWDPEHSYGWWPDTGNADISFKETFKGVPGILNDGEPEDPHHNEDAHHEFHPTMMVEEDADYDTVRAQVTSDIANFANSFQGSWNWRLGWGKNCHTFQARLKKQLGLHHQKSKRWLRNPGQTWRQIMMAEYHRMMAERLEAERLQREAWAAQQEAERLRREAEEAEREAERIRLEQEAEQLRQEEAERLAERRRLKEAQREAKLARKRERQARREQREAARKERREAAYIPIPEDIEAVEERWERGTGSIFTPKVLPKGTRIKVADSPSQFSRDHVYYSIDILNYNNPGVYLALTIENGEKMLRWTADAKQEAEAKAAKEEQEDEKSQIETVDNLPDEGVDQSQDEGVDQSQDEGVDQPQDEDVDQPQDTQDGDQIQDENTANPPDENVTPTPVVETKEERRARRRAEKERRAAERRAKEEATYTQIPEKLDVMIESVHHMSGNSSMRAEVLQAGTRVKKVYNFPVTRSDGNKYYKISVLNWNGPQDMYLSVEDGQKFMAWAEAAKQESENSQIEPVV